jgi:hypothetical protein
VTVVVSDVHLSQAHPEDPRDPLWMRYRLREHHPDRDLAALVDHLLRAFAGDAIELVHNGDLFDFDAPWVKGGTSSFDEPPPTEAAAVAQVERILADHPLWFRAVARLVAAGHRALFVSGNHDLELYWPGVRAAVRAAIARHAAPMGATARDVEERVRFRAWFHVTDDGIYLEHGSQYDTLNGVRHPMLPLTRDRSRLHPVTGKLAFRRAGARIGYLNPYDPRTFSRGLVGWARHYLAHYAGSPERHAVRTWARGALATALEVLRHRHDEDWAAEERALAHAETGAPERAIAATQALRVELAEDTMLPIVRQLWLDRLGLALVVGAASVVASAVVGPRRGATVTGALALAFAGYETLVPKPAVESLEAPPPGVRALFEIHRVRALCFGHTHRPFGVWEGDRFHGNSGSWAPAFRDAECLEPMARARPVLLLVSDGASLTGGLYRWSPREARLEPDPTGARSIPPSAASARTRRGSGISLRPPSRSSCRPRSPGRPRSSSTRRTARSPARC